MRKVYVIGGGNTSIERIREITSTPINVEIIYVESMEDVPLKERTKSDPSVIQQIHEFKTLPMLPPMRYFDDDKRRGHERPYKFHK